MKRILYILTLVVSVFVAGNANAVAENRCPSSAVLVAYFSATSNTAKVAEKIYQVSKSHGINTDLFEIKPKQPYTEADLNWHNKQSRSSIEMNDPASRPAIVNKVKNIDKYDVIFVGFPIWWDREPSIIDTFIESYNFDGKEIIPFATSGSSDIDGIYKNIEALAPKAYVDRGKRFPMNISEQDEKNLDSWVFEYVMPMCVIK
ncbi:MAG: flavodoxin [Alphaproteobacteria bacterium]|nr:flavodoxin [Alphaproteobacteria bacterium]